jgi:drug/metabolite transporter (DMT)-like permease
MNSLIFYFILAILSPLAFAFMNILDKYVVSHRVKKSLGFSIMAGVAAAIFGLVLALFLDWRGFRLSDYLIPIVVGLLMGSQYFLYYHIMKNEDASNFVGLTYTYPVLVAFLSFVFLHEILSVISYIGLFCIMTGAVLLSVRMKKLKLKVSLWAIVGISVMIAFNAFIIKIYTTNMPELNGIAVNCIAIGLAVLCGLFNKKLRNDARVEIKRFHWALLTEFFTFLGLFTLYIAIKGLPVTIVSSIAAAQPLFLLFFERIAQNRFGKMSRDYLLLPKLKFILLIVLGIILLYLPEILKSIN